MNAKIITTPKGERLAILPAEEYEDMCDALILAEATSDYRAGRDEGITIEEMRELLDAPTPLAFWRRKRGIAPASLAEAAGLTEADIIAFELGSRSGSREEVARIAAVLKIKVEELVV